MLDSTEKILNELCVLVTAGASGIGRCIAERFLSAGCRVHVCDNSKENIDTFITHNPLASASLVDVSNSAQVEQLFEEIEIRYGRLDVVVNNAGIAGPTAPLEEVSIADWDATIAVDLNAPFYVTRKAVPLLKKACGGSIINIASSAAFYGYPLRSPYCAAKWALIGLTKTWAMELGVYGIRVNAICPGSVEGERIDKVIEREAALRGVDKATIRKLYVAQTSLEKFVTAADIANMAVYLSSTLGATISGQAIGVDGHTEGLSNKVG